ncbi:MAG: DUF2182 domain-containing protein [Caulobacterales bacterium]
MGVPMAVFRRPALLLAAPATAPWPALIGVSLAGWAACAWPGHGLDAASLCSASAWRAASWRALAWALDDGAAGRFAASWLAMLTAMMAPLIALPVSHIWRRSLARRRVRAIALFVAAYGAVWMAGGLALTLIAAGLVSLAGGDRALALALAVALAAAWRLSPAKQALLNRCHRLPTLAPFGWAADSSCARYGLTAGLTCFGACWAPMLVPLTAPGAHLALMALTCLILTAERLAPASPPRWGWVLARTRP